MGPWFEGQMAGTLAEILSKESSFPKMLRLAIGYILAILIVQGARYVKRLYVRNFANNVNRAMKRVLFGNLVRKSRAELEKIGRASCRERV